MSRSAADREPSPLSNARPRESEGERAGAPLLRWFWPFVVGCLVVQALLAVDCARRWTPTHDEFWHLPIGLRMWTSGRFDDDVINPPLVRLWAAMPLALGGAEPGDAGTHPDVGQIGDAFWQAGGDRIRFWFLLGRLMIIPLLSLTGVGIVLWSRSWYGERAALVSVMVWTCCPTVLANAAIVTHDLPLAAAWTLTLLALVRFAEQPSWRRALLFGVALGIAPLAKLTGLVLVPLSVVLWFVLRGRRPMSQTAPTRCVSEGERERPFPAIPSLTLRVTWLTPVLLRWHRRAGAVGHNTPIPDGCAVSNHHTRGRLLVRWVAALAVSLAVLNAGYLFRGTGASLGSLKLVSSRLQAIQRAASGFRGLPVPLPRDFIGALDRLAQDIERHHPVYLDGEWSDRPFALYYAAALCYKLPLSTLLLVLAGLVGTARPRPGTSDRRHGLFLLIAALVLPILASGSSNQIGIRYVLPTLPVLCVFAGQSARWLEGSSRRWTSRLVWVALVAAPFSLRFHPHHLAYFNATAGGPAGGSHHLVDSNIDWGQDLHALNNYLNSHDINDVGLAYFGTVVPAKVGIQSHQPPSRFPQPGWHAISVNFVQGRPHALRDSNGDRVQVGIDEFGYFRFFEPVARIGYSINVYRLTPQDVERYAVALRRMQRDAR